MDPAQTAFQFANDLAKELITLATGIIALSITFTKDIISRVSNKATWLLKWAWIAYFLSICFGIWTMMALTGTLMPLNSQPDGLLLTFGSNVRIPAGLQIILFIVGTILIIAYGAKSLKGNSQDAVKPPAIME